ncbi:hypothetical protein B0O80DRAFT_304112 [Mortierella sp. GBAus27b]|nr:RNA binding protein, heterogenous nuclear RNP-K like protein [Mortierella sp. GBA43]KAI8357007.1 hypothetical protein B0O80DRAFT_304112 [Mortierella sp. GBAus27b]
MSFQNTTATSTSANSGPVDPDAMYYEGQYEHDDREGDVLIDSEAPLTLRALVSTKEAGVIIGRGGKNVADLRDQTGVKAGVSKVVQGVQDRVLTVTGTIEGVAKAFALIAQTLLENPITSSPPSTPVNPLRPIAEVTSIRLLISHNLMGTIIGRQGLKIKHIQDTSSARMVASKEMLPQSTERVVEVQGTVDAIRIAIYEIGKCLVEDWDRGVGTVLYSPSGPTRAGASTGASGFSGSTPSSTGTRAAGAGAGAGAGVGVGAGAGSGSGSGSASGTGYASRTGNGSDFTGGQPQQPINNANLRTQEISIPADMVGCIIGRGGSKISEIRRLSGSRISIAKTPHDETGERMFTIVGTAESNEKALYLLYGQLEVEKEKRLNMSENQMDEDEM